MQCGIRGCSGGVGVLKTAEQGMHWAWGKLCNCILIPLLEYPALHRAVQICTSNIGGIDLMDECAFTKGKEKYIPLSLAASYPVMDTVQAMPTQVRIGL